MKRAPSWHVATWHRFKQLGLDETMPASPPTRFVVALAGLGFAALFLVAVISRPSMNLDQVVPERHVRVESIQAWLWVITAAVAAIGCLGQTTRRGVLLLIWLAIVAFFAGLRELDLHVVLNPENIHLLGLREDQAVRFRMRWWLGGETPVSLRFAWGVAFFLFGTLIVVPFAMAGYPWPRQLLRGARFPWFVVLGFLLMLSGLLIDDVGRPLQRAGVKLNLIEELIELLGQLLILSGVILLALRKVDLCTSGLNQGDQ